MHYRKFQNHNISEIGLGTWQLGNADWGVINDEDAFAILKAFADAGGNFIDTADVYGNGASEKNYRAISQTNQQRSFCCIQIGPQV